MSWYKNIEHTGAFYRDCSRESAVYWEIGWWCLGSLCSGRTVLSCSTDSFSFYVWVHHSRDKFEVARFCRRVGWFGSRTHNALGYVLDVRLRDSRKTPTAGLYIRRALVRYVNGDIPFIVELYYTSLINLLLAAQHRSGSLKQKTVLASLKVVHTDQRFA